MSFSVSGALWQEDLKTRNIRLLFIVIKLRTTDTQREFFFFKNPKLLGLGRQIGLINFGVFGVFSAELSALFCHCESLGGFSYKKLLPSTKYDIGHNEFGK